MSGDVMGQHPGFVHMPDWQVTASRRALALARSMVLCGEKMSDAAQAEIDAALGYLVPYDSKRAEPIEAEPMLIEVDGLEHRLVAALATASAVAVANGKWAREAERRLAVAEGIVTELRHVWPLLRGCAHDFDPECARCQWLRALTEALQTVDESEQVATHSQDGQA